MVPLYLEPFHYSFLGYKVAKSCTRLAISLRTDSGETTSNPAPILVCDHKTRCSAQRQQRTLHTRHLHNVRMT